LAQTSKLNSSGEPDQLPWIESEPPVFTAHGAGSMCMYLKVSINGGTPKWMLYDGKSYED